MTAWYGGALLLILALFALAMYGGVRRVLQISVAQRVDAAAVQLDSYVRDSAHGPFAPVSVIAALSEQDALDRFAGPGLYIEVYNAQGFAVGKTSNLA